MKPLLKTSKTLCFSTHKKQKATCNRQQEQKKRFLQSNETKIFVCTHRLFVKPSTSFTENTGTFSIQGRPQRVNYEIFKQHLNGNPCRQSWIHISGKSYFKRLPGRLESQMQNRCEVDPQGAQIREFPIFASDEL